MADNMCRLCLNKNDLLWVFDEVLPKNSSEIIEVTSGVKISKEDSVSQMVCSTCCQLTMKMYKFRASAIKNDKELKAKSADSNMSHITNDIQTTTAKSKNSNSLRPKFVHPSVQEILQRYPNIKLPNECLKSHVGAYITLLSDEVDEWYKERNFTDKQIAKLKADSYALFNVPHKISEKKRKNLSREENDSNATAEKAVVKKLKINPVTDNKKVEKLNNELNLNGTKIIVKNVPQSIEPGVQKSIYTLEKLPSVKITKTVPDFPAQKVSPQLKSSVLHEIGKTQPSKTPIVIATKAETKLHKEFIREGAEQTSILKNKMEPHHLNKTLLTDTNGQSSVNCDKKESQPCKASEQPLKPSTVLDDRIESVLKLLLNDKTAEKSKVEDITLKSILRDSVNVGKAKSDYAVVDDDVIEVVIESEPPKLIPEVNLPPRGPSRLSNKGADTLTKEVVLREKQNQSNGTDCINNNDAASKFINQGSSTNFSRTDKHSFAEALNLAPRSSDLSNMPDLSLVSFASKSYTLYTCKVCDSQHTSLKDLKYHERKTHRKCPFCNKRFRTLALRDEHVNNSCSVNDSVIKLKGMRLELVRVDEDSELREKYASAFEYYYQSNNSNNGNDKGNQPSEIQLNREQKNAEATTSVNLVRDKNVQGDRRLQGLHSNTQADDTISQMGRFLGIEDDLAVADNIDSHNQGNRAQSEDPNSKTGDVICISDDESENPRTSNLSTNQGAHEERINVVDSEILSNINIHDNDFNILKRILSQHNVWSIPDTPIVDGNSNRVKIFRKLRPHLTKYKIPIEVKYSQTVSVEYKATKAVPPKKCHNIWHNLTPIKLKPAIFPRISNLSSPNPSLLNGQGTPNKTVVESRPSVGDKGVFNGMPNIIKKPSELQRTRLNTVVENSATPTAIILQPAIVSGANQSTPLLLTTTSSSNTITPSNSSVLKNGTHNVTSPSISSVTSYIIVPSSLLSTPTLVSTQARLPVVEAVNSTVQPTAAEQLSSSRVAELESITNSLMPTSENLSIPTASSEVPCSLPGVSESTNNVTAARGSSLDSDNHQPSIRVKDLEKLF